MKVGGSLGYYNQEENLVDVGTGGLNSVRMITEGFAIPACKISRWKHGQRIIIIPVQKEVPILFISCRNGNSL